MTLLEVVSNFPEWNIGEPTVKNALMQRGYACHLLGKETTSIGEE